MPKFVYPQHAAVLLECKFPQENFTKIVSCYSDHTKLHNAPLRDLEKERKNRILQYSLNGSKAKGMTDKHKSRVLSICLSGFEEKRLCLLVWVCSGHLIVFCV